ncbi:hypothetical protein FGF66_01720 [Chlorobaculum thiosulfatiphilum]|uniref:HD-CE domain-containing protein n=1 Tax=Chlorobaculum thiosulfatiphilum TaxID=115852 RepID=A0A5C4SA61_CHLTI|nr:ATP-binding protein [Chlorobaculum thiosulfatiphilum]TNJ40038.1 hypothetical protein FGF66_01720 [Chlorobaculum thiosulfatiphilum]
MAKIEFPKQLKELLEESNLQAPIRALADRVGEILADNKLTFFPDYTDHGVEHVNRVLKSEVELVPKEVWERSKRDSDPRLLCDADAAVIIGASLLHDIAMHLRPDGFLELVGKDSRFQPFQWFSESHEGYAGDAPWHELWLEYEREARRFSDRDLTNIIGEESARLWKFDELPADSGQWELNHRLIVGEFIRRHHARLAHEIAIYGFPGLEVGSGEGHFPAMGAKGDSLNLLADLIGLTARSHGMNLRVCKAYLDDSPRYAGMPKPMGTAALYPMALLRVADYFQINRQRAPAVLLQLRNPQSPVSVQEWKKHLAVQHIGPTNDPRGKMVKVSSDLSLPLYLQLRELLSGLQAEMDHSTAVLDEAYSAQSALGLDRLNLAIRRVDSNLQSPAFRDALSYVPDKTGFAADPNLLTLLVEPLYGKEPGVGVRELMQNAIDAVCELDAWRKVHDVPIESLDLPEQEGDVMIDFIKRDDGSWFLRVQDRGIGMTSDTIQNYFLRAGASFRRSSEWSKEFVDDEGKPRIARAGRFGIGVFAVFLLGLSFKMWTRHVGADKRMGYMVEASEASQLIEIQRRNDLPVGTTIEVEISSESTEWLELDEETYSEKKGPNNQIDWFCWDWPKVIKRVIRSTASELLNQQYICPVRSSKLPPEWSVIFPKGFDAVLWTFSDQPTLSCNGLMIAQPEEKNLIATNVYWPSEIQLKSPNIAVIDKAANMPLTTQRYDLSDDLPFIDELARDVLLSFIAHALICGAMSQEEACSNKLRHTLQNVSTNHYKFNVASLFGIDVNQFFDSDLHWCSTSEEMAPADPWLYKTLHSESCFLSGYINGTDSYHPIEQEAFYKSLIKKSSLIGKAVLPWFGEIKWHYEDEYDERINNVWSLITKGLDSMNGRGVIGLGKTEYHVIFSDYPSILHFSDIVKFSKTDIGEFSKKYYQNEQIEFGYWREIQKHNSQRRWFETQSGSINLDPNVEKFIEAMETDFGNIDGVLFVAEIKPTGVDQPQSMIAKIWDECLGPKAIPFDHVAREALIAEGCKHPELKRHIEAWQEMKRTGSKWATGEWMNEKD